MTLPVCYEHKDPITHPPVLCHTEHVWHPVVCPKRVKEKVAVSNGTHLGHLDKEARERRAAKNARNASRAASGSGTRPRGSQRSGR